MWLLALSAAAADPGLLGFYADPDVHGPTVVFCSEGDLWTVLAGGGLASRLTRSDGAEAHPRFSPDGHTVAFTADYDGGGPDVYVMPVEGGEPRRLSFHPSPERVTGWTPDGRHVLFRSDRDEPLGRDRIWSVPVDGGPASLVPVGLGTQLELAPGGSFGALVPSAQLGLHAARYTGGGAADIWLGDLRAKVWRPLTTWIGEDHTPMWHGDRIFFLSNRAGLLDLWSVGRDGTGLRSHTRFDDFPIREAAIGGDTVVFTQGGDLWTLDARAPAAVPTRIPVRLRSDAEQRRPRQSAGAPELLTGLSPHPTAERVVVEARGRLYSVAGDGGRTIALSQGPGRDRGGRVSPDGTRVAAWNDGAGEERLVIYDADGVAPPRPMPGTEGGWHFPVRWSPTGDRLAWGDQTGTLRVVELASGKVEVIDRDDHLEIDQYSFSPDGLWIAWTRSAPNQNGVVWVRALRGGARAAVTDPDTHSFRPEWDPSGRALYVLSARTWDPLVSGDDSSPAYATGPAQDWPEFGSFLTDMARPYAILLDARQSSPFLAPDPLRPALPAVEGPLRVDLPGIVARTVPVPLPAGNYTDLVATADAVWALDRPPLRLSDVDQDVANRPGTLRGWHLGDREPLEGPDGVDEVAATGDGLALRRGDAVELAGADTLSEPPTPVDLAAVARRAGGATEWAEIFEESWRAYRDFFWAPNFVGVDWAQKRALYRPLAARVGSRQELNEVVGQMIAELANPHAYMTDGDVRSVPAAPTGLLGADLTPTAAGLRITRVYTGAAWDPEAAGPLAAPGLDVREGDLVVAVDGVACTGAEVDPLAWFVGKGDTDVVLRVLRPPLGAPRDVVVHAVASDAAVRHHDHVAERRAWVVDRSAGAVGYLHLRDMMGPGFADFARGWYAQNDRAGFVLDLRNNGGGYVSQLLLERLRRRLTAYVLGRNAQIPESDAWRAFPGPMVVLVDGGTASDGESFTHIFQSLKLGKVVGTRTWGGLVGYRVARTVVDGGFRSEPEFAQYDLAGRWVVEAHGVEPDVVVLNDPGALATGRDPQLAAAVDIVLAEIRAAPPLPKGPPAWPDRSLEAWRAAHPLPVGP